MCVSAIICVYTMERWDDICEAVQSLRNQSMKVDEIIIVCDHNAELKQKCERKFPDVKVVENLEQQGLSGGRNTGIRTALHDLIVFFDDDAVADRQFVEKLVQHFEDPKIYAVSGRCLPIWRGKRPFWFPDEYLWTVGCTYLGMPKTASVVRNPSGGVMCLRRDLFESVGGFNHHLGRTKSKVPISCEETELFIRVRNMIPEAKVVYEPDAVAGHKVTSQRLTLSYFTLRCYAEGLSKAILAAISSGSNPLDTEQDYVAKTLIKGVLRELGAGVTLRDIGGFGRAYAIILGLAYAGGGFAIGKFRSRNLRIPKAKSLAASI